MVLALCACCQKKILSSSAYVVPPRGFIHMFSKATEDLFRNESIAHGEGSVGAGANWKGAI
jgi:hypothetical protein